jgi:hypothetical protein
MEFARRLREGHHKLCPWLHNASPASFATFPSSPLTLMAHFNRRWRALTQTAATAESDGTPLPTLPQHLFTQLVRISFPLF